MRKYIVLTMIFIVCMSSFAFADCPDLPADVEEFENGYFVTYEKNDYRIFEIKEKPNENGVGFTDVSHLIEDSCTGTINFKYFYDKQKQEWRLVNAGSSTFNYRTVIYSTCDLYIRNNDNSVRDVFFSPKITIQDIPGMVGRQVLPVAGVGILLISLMLLPDLLRKLYNF